GIRTNGAAASLRRRRHLPGESHELAGAAEAAGEASTAEAGALAQALGDDDGRGIVRVDRPWNVEYGRSHRCHVGCRPCWHGRVWGTRTQGRAVGNLAAACTAWNVKWAEPEAALSIQKTPGSLTVRLRAVPAHPTRHAALPVLRRPARADY